ncbi:GNAT family N-acetyltransferase [Pseudomonas sp. TTU2014-080ASC]|uniref:GNAT family N-acetyltransferase n=1 Tax=Pseudomonas sp. TTU2014-080ASC TaxID=1729724 RepID=UPI0007184762|nr:GNAT family N-acetyltransferase [Pseudomonas sp. TTU2014-080ASC]KRW61659.1 GNAT family acetyltransferase [Pseudomonas sp. TTU2014-080ASC]
MSHNPHFSHRPVNASDLGDIIGFVQNADELFYCYPKGHWPLTIGQLAATMAERRDSTVALVDGKIAGFANFFQWKYDDHCALGNLMIAPWARSKGVAQYLIGVMEELAQQHYHAKELRVSCFNGNSAGLLLYPKLGYQPVAVVERSRDAERVALIQFSKPLQ